MYYGHLQRITDSFIPNGNDRGHTYIHSSSPLVTQHEVHQPKFKHHVRRRHKNLVSLSSQVMRTHISMAWQLSSSRAWHVQLVGEIEGDLLLLAPVHNLLIAHHHETRVAQVGCMQLITLHHQNANCAAALHRAMSLDHGWCPSLVMSSKVACRCAYHWQHSSYPKLLVH